MLDLLPRNQIIVGHTNVDGLRHLHRQLHLAIIAVESAILVLDMEIATATEGLDHAPCHPEAAPAEADPTHGTAIINDRKKIRRRKVGPKVEGKKTTATVSAAAKREKGPRSIVIDQKSGNIYLIHMQIHPPLLVGMMGLM